MRLCLIGLPTTPSLCLWLPLVSIDPMGVLHSRQPQFSSKFSVWKIARTHPLIECKADYYLNFRARVLRCTIMNLWPMGNHGGCVRQSNLPSTRHLASAYIQPTRFKLAGYSGGCVRNFSIRSNNFLLVGLGT
ncbi:hypothetical protein B0H14DRAFT_2584872 [Mycena olivaceomarginata]|nr:hypothetical protein B0H14DRAFT_2584872 [Mycena olivaceomarginata]